MNALLLFSHGSVLCGSERTLDALAERLRKENAAPIIEVGYLNYSSPLFEESFNRCIEQGATEITIVPYFLVAGKFVVVDLPREIEKQRALFPHVKVRVADAMRFHPKLADAIISCARNEQAPAAWRDVLQLAPESCRASQACPLFGTAKCPASNEQAGKTPRQSTVEFDRTLSNTAKPSLLLMAHGSPRAKSNEDLYQVAELVRSRDTFENIVVCFMECNAPDIPTGIDELVQSGARDVVAVPYFLHPGNHVADDLPTILESAQLKYSDVRFSMGDYLGRDDAIAHIICDRAAAAK